MSRYTPKWVNVHKYNFFALFKGGSFFFTRNLFSTWALWCLTRCSSLSRVRSPSSGLDKAAQQSNPHGRMLLSSCLHNSYPIPLTHSHELREKPIAFFSSSLPSPLTSSPPSPCATVLDKHACVGLALCTASHGSLTWVYHIGYSTLSSLVRIQEGIGEAHKESNTEPNPRNYVK
jgi:hypothetical protein